MTSAAKVGIVMLVALAVLGYFVLRIEDINLGGSRTMREVKVVFDNAAGLEDEATVRIGGVRKGHVTNVQSLPDGRALVTMQIADDVPLHSDASAAIANLGLLGERYIEIDPGSARAPIVDAQTVTIRGTQAPSIDDITNEVAAIAKDVKAITASLRGVMAGPAGQQRLEDEALQLRDGCRVHQRSLITR